ncbi:hypothetical protein N0O92_14000 [Alkalihalobacillus sp. MEB130]|uniref:hypothetical protein n=1 Tax=Alkalihalobacillus sp. MEB130 TaxID=2976704 RepID=UPI0028DE5B49|nr:hypothetical protein [Alkalihalobacillus sp. MEB130]MDT8861348.1 hypothetical protein [Alkalihalobacillus sp. MEB130]
MDKVKETVDVVKLLSRCQNALIFVEEPSSIDAVRLLNAANEQGIPYQLFTNKLPLLSKLLTINFKEIEPKTFKTNFTIKELNVLLTKQKIGTKLFIFGNWHMVNSIKREALNEGFTDEDLYVAGYGEKKKRVLYQVLKVKFFQ